jgi:hypothetical protein
MNSSKRILIATALVLLAGLGTGTTAQSKADLRVSNIVPIPVETTVTLKVNAIEINDGVVGVDPRFGETVFGYNLLGLTSGELPGSFMLSMNCAPAIFTPGGSNQIAGGAWSLPVYMRPLKGLNIAYMGSLYGTIVNGKMDWDKLGNADIYMTFSVDGGTQTWDRAKGTGTFQGTLTADEKGTSTLRGELTITYALATTR